MINIEDIISVVKSLFSNEITSVKPINKGVMTYKFEFNYQNTDYVIRVYPTDRQEFASLEKEYYRILHERNVKMPHFVTSSVDISFSRINFIIYEKLHGKTLRETFSSLEKTQKIKLITQVNDNYSRISDIKANGAGIITYSLEFSHSSWIGFLKDVIIESTHYAKQSKSLSGIDIPKLFAKLEFEVRSCVSEKRNFTWSDFNPDNIIVNTDGNLVGFIDFESILGADPLLGIGYLYARDGDTEFYKLYGSLYINDKEERLVNLYGVIRYLRLLPFLDKALPNGQARDPINEFLPKAYATIKQYSTT